MYHQFMELAEVDITKQPMEVGPTCHYVMGGVEVDPDTGAARVAGLFAAGECSGGMHGSNRLGGILLLGRSISVTQIVPPPQAITQPRRAIARAVIHTPRSYSPDPPHTATPRRPVRRSNTPQSPHRHAEASSPIGSATRRRKRSRGGSPATFVKSSASRYDSHE